jgi:hypothetical protein
MKTVEVNFDISSIFRDYVVVDRGTGKILCTCPIEKMNPIVPVNYKEWKDCRICTECGNTVTDEANRNYNEYYGYSGFDEHNYPETDDVEEADLA